MEFIENLLSNATALSAIIAAVISLAASYLVARLTAKNEIKKLERSYSREDQVEEEAAFRQMVASVTVFIHETYFDESSDALRDLAVARTYKTGYVAELMDELSQAIAVRDRRLSHSKLAEIIVNNRRSEGV